MDDVVQLSVNGEERTVVCDPDTPLLYLLRNDLGLLGTKFGCGAGLCGACAVLVDGHPTYSCDTPAWSVVGKSVTTVEGLGRDGEPHRVQLAFEREQALQCGYCTSGMVVAAAALVDRGAAINACAVREALDGHLCRCGAHNRIVRAVLAAAKQE